MTVPRYLEARLAELGDDVDALARELVREGWHQKNVERVLGVTMLADGAPAPHGAKPATSPPGAAPAPRRRGGLDPAAAAPPRERPSRPRLLGPVRRPRLELVEPVDPEGDTEPAPPPAPPARKSNIRLLPIEERPRMHPGPGKRHDCVHESDCLGRALQAHGNDLRAVHCPEWCKHLEAPSREQRYVEATAGKAEGYSR